MGRELTWAQKQAIDRKKLEKRLQRGVEDARRIRKAIEVLRRQKQWWGEINSPALGPEANGMIADAMEHIAEVADVLGGYE